MLMTALCIVPSCGGGSKVSLIDYNEKVITEFNKVAEKIASDREIIFDHSRSKAESEKLIEEMKKVTSDFLQMMNGINCPEDAKAFHEALIELNQYQLNTMLPLLSETLKYEPESEEWYAIWREFDNKTSEVVDAAIERATGLQEELARKAGSYLKN